MKNPFSFLIQKRVSLPGEQNLNRAVRRFSQRERLLFSFFLVLMVISVIGLLIELDRSYSVETPRHGGSFTEGVVGFPRFVNPLLASSDTDRDLTALIYSGLMRVGPDGTLIPDLASAPPVISEDGKTYTFTLRDDAVWQDGTPVTADDVVFTIQKAQDPALRSPVRANWEGVTAEALDPLTVRFSLSQAYTPFIQNTTMGILPKHIWGDVGSDQFSFSRYNIEPVGTGPYEVGNVTRDRGGIPQYYNLKAFSRFTLGEPYISNIKFAFYNNQKDLENALAGGSIESLGSMETETAAALSKEGKQILEAPLPRVFGVFFNENKVPAFTDASARQALSVAIDRDALIQNTLGGYGTALFGPLPPGTLGYEPQTDTATSSEDRLAQAKDILAKGGWKYNEEKGVMEKTVNKKTIDLTFSISTGAIPELKAAADMLADTWKSLGAQVDVKVFETGNLDQQVIRPRDYDALLFGEIIARDSDPFAFWDSSQRLDPGLNIALYTNANADKILEKARVTLSDQDRATMYQNFSDIIEKDVPAAFLYSPDFLYLVPNRIQGIELNSIAIPSDRFSNIYQWYIETQSIWRIFS